MKICKSSLLFFLVLLISCEGHIFHEEDYEYISTFDEDEVIALVNGVYNNLREVHNSDYFKAMSRADDINVYQRNNQNICRIRTYDESENPFADVLDNIYLNIYKAVANINTLFLVLKEPHDKNVLGELYFLRAYCYFKLARLFGTPPLVSDIDVKFLIEKPTYKEVYEFIEKDMLKALELLPETYTDARIPGETPHKGTAKAMLAEIYLAMAGYPVNDISKYAEAARLAGEVINQAEYYNYGLLDDMADLWKNTNRHNKENIFGLFYFCNECDVFVSMSSSTDLENWKRKLSNVNKINNIDFDKTFIRGYLDGYNPGAKFFLDFPNQYRKRISFVTGKYIESNLETFNGTEKVILFYPVDPNRDYCNFIECCMSKKWNDLKYWDIIFDEWAKTRDRNDRESYWELKNLFNTVTLYLFRYAHTLLTYAEAKIRAGELDETCFEAVNMIRRRANKLDIYTPSQFDLHPDLSPEQFLDSLVWERAWELCTEPEGRWFDIIRLDLRSELSEYTAPFDKYATFKNEQLTEDWYFFQIPIEDRWINPNY